MTDPKAAFDNNNWNFLHDAVSHNDRAFHLCDETAGSILSPKKRLARIQPKPMFNTLLKNFRLRLGSLQASAAFFQKK
jgi:hypothetical protein